MKHYTWIGDDHPPGWRRVGTIDIADPADSASARDRGYRIGGVYEGGSGSVAEPCAADIYKETCGLRWERQSGNWQAYSGQIVVALIGILPSGEGEAPGKRWWYSLYAVQIAWVARGNGEAPSEHRAKAAVEEAWAAWLEHCGLIPDPHQEERRG